MKAVNSTLIQGCHSQSYRSHLGVGVLYVLIITDQGKRGIWFLGTSLFGSSLVHQA